jgi:hypothetical protein
MSVLHFMTNPVDIIASVFIVLKAGEEFVKQNHLENRFGPYVSMFDRNKVANVSQQLSFDDFFPMFCLIFALACPVNGAAISDLISRLTGMALSPAFDFAKLFFTSALQYVKNVKVAELGGRHFDDEEDPLGLSHLKSDRKIPKLLETI